MKKGQTAAAILLLSLALNGCGGGNGTTAFAPTETSLYVTKEGTVTSADVETYENDYYSADELKAYAEEMLGVFESGNQSGSSEKKAEIAECTVKDGTAKLLITFPDAEEYLRFSEEYPDTESGIRIESLDVVSVPDGVEKGYIVGSTFYKAGDENTEVSAVDITKQKKLYVVCVKGSAKIQTDGQVRYVSEGVTLNGSMAETPEGETSYIIFTVQLVCAFSCAGRKKTLFEGLDSYNRRITLPRRPARTERDQEESHNGKDNGKNCSTCEIQRLCISGFRDLRRSCKHMGLRQSGRRA